MTPEEQLSILWTYVEAGIPTRPYVAFDVAFGGKADMTFCGAHVCL
jgi:hypothetical protein